MKKQWKVLVLSLIYPGLGDLYAGKVLKGIIQIAIITNILFIMFKIGFSDSIFLTFMVPTIVTLWILLAVNAALNTPDDGIKVTEDFKKRVCPECGNDVPLEEEECFKCHKRLKDVLFYSIGSEGWIDYTDIEINKREIIEYKKGLMGKRNGKIEKFPIVNIKDFEIKRMKPVGHTNLHNMFYELRFKFIDERGINRKKTLHIPQYKRKELRKALKIRNIPYNDFVEIDGNY
jgi:TM2 domain-containing membrane protein YozV